MRTLLQISIFAFLLTPNLVRACPDIAGLVDVNCDNRIVIACFGDSITSGVRDSAGLGYPGRLGLLMPGVQIINLGVAGEQTIRGKVRAASILAALPEADYSIVLEGVNDFFIDGQTVTSTRSNLNAILQSSQRAGTQPLLAKLTPVNRTDQGVWVRDVNSAIAGIARIDFSNFNKRTFLSSDNLHPHGGGYQEMAARAQAALLGMTGSIRPADTDGDGVYDFAEARFGASVGTVDTDNDGISDGAEIFTYRTNPGSTDTDGDGFSDDFEINTLMSDPTSPYPSAPSINSITVSNPRG